MKKSNKIIVSMGVVALVSAPVAIALTTNTSNKWSADFLNKSHFSQGIDAYWGTTKTPVAPDVKPELKEVNNIKVARGFMTQTSDGTTYVGTNGNGLKKLVNGKLEDVDSSLVQNGFMNQASDGTIYVGTQRAGLKKLVNGKLEDVDSTSVEYGFRTQTSDKTIYVRTKDHGLKKLVNGKLVYLAGGKTVDFYKGFMTQTSDGTKYVGTAADGLKKLVNGKLVDFLGVKKTDPNFVDVVGGFMTQTSDGTIYVGTNAKGLKKLVNGKLEDVDSTSVNNGFIKEINGTIYVGTEKEGLKKLVNGKLVDFVGGPTVDVSEGWMTQTSDGTRYVGTYNNGLQKLDFTEVSKTNEDFVKQTYNGIEINDDPSKSLKEIVEEIKDKTSLEKYTGIKFPKMNYSTIGKIKATLDKSNPGKMDLEIEVKTKIEVKTNIITHIVQTKVSYTATLNRLIAEANALQKRNKTKVDTAFAKAKFVNQGIRTTSEIAKLIKDAASLKTEIGIDVDALKLEPGTTIGTISATADANGKLTITIEQTTAGATTPLATSTKVIQGKSDVEIAKLKADTVQKAFHDKIVKTIEEANLKIDKGPKLSDIIKQIKDAKDVKAKIELLKKLGVQLDESLKLDKAVSKINGITAIAKPDGSIEIHVTTDTQGASVAHDEIVAVLKKQNNSSKGYSKVGLIAGITVSSLALIGAGSGTLIYRKKRKRK